MATAPSLAGSRRLVVKIGSALLVEPAGALRQAWLEALADDVAALRAGGAEVILVSSGAIAAGRPVLGLAGRALRLEEKQAAAATGQIRLAHAYQAALARHGLTVAQVLLTLEDTEERRRHLNARATLSTLLRLGAVPVINENDTVATSEIRFGDNDRLAARVAAMIEADTLVLLSDIDGLYTANPAEDPGQIDLQNWCIYRAGWTVDEAQAQKNGARQQSSMEIGAILDDLAFTNGAAVLNRAQSLSVALVNTTNLLAWNTGLVDAPKLLIFGSSVAKGFHGPGSPGYTNGSYLLGYAGLLTPVVESSGWVVTNASIGGNDTAAALARFDTDAVPLDPDVILIGLSLGNEGLATSPDSAAVYESFRSGLTNLIHRFVVFVASGREDALNATNQH